jgi:hypothetical protein
MVCRWSVRRKSRCVSCSRPDEPRCGRRGVVALPAFLLGASGAASQPAPRSGRRAARPRSNEAKWRSIISRRGTIRWFLTAAAGSVACLVHPGHVLPTLSLEKSVGDKDNSVVAETIRWFQSDDTLAWVSVRESPLSCGAIASRRLQQRKAVSQTAASVNAVWEGSAQLVLREIEDRESSVACQSVLRTGEAEMRPEQVAEKGVVR